MAFHPAGLGLQSNANELGGTVTYWHPTDTAAAIATNGYWRTAPPADGSAGAFALNRAMNALRDFIRAKRGGSAGRTVDDATTLTDAQVRRLGVPIHIYGGGSSGADAANAKSIKRSMYLQDTAGDAGSDNVLSIEH